MVRKSNKSFFSEDDEDPMAGTSNLVDAMLVIAVGLLVFLVISWNMQGVVFDTEMTPEERKNQMEKIKQVTEMEQGQELEDTPEVQDQSGEGYTQMGTIYKDTETGKLIMIT